MSGALPLAREAAHGLALVAFDCDGVLVDAHSSWRVLHEHFGTDNGDMLHRFIAGEVSDAEFMRDDIRMWKEAHPGLTRDHLFRAYAGLCLIPGARDTIRTLQLLGVEVAIVSAGVDLLVGAMARALHVTRWHANGFLHDDDGLLLDEGVVRVPASDKASTVRAIMDELACPAEAVVSVGDSEMDLSMRVPGSRFIGFCPSRESSHWAFAEAEVEVVHERDLRAILPLLLGAAGAALRAELESAS